jgi:alkaline phosphatase D
MTRAAVAQNVSIPGLDPETPFLGDPSLVEARRFAIVPGSRTAGVFSCGAASGDPAPDGIVLWTRVDPKAVTSLAANLVVWEISSTPSFGRNVVLRGAARFSDDTDYTVKIAIQHPALRPFTVYFYRFIFHGTPTRVCRFKTLPAPGAFLSRLRIAYISCQDYTNGYYTALAHLANEDIDYVIHLGDYIYESIGDPRFQHAQVRPIESLPSGLPVANSLQDYRFLYQIYRSDANLQAVHERFAFIQIWDDHEFQNDSWRDQHPDNNSNPALPRPDLRQQANQAWAEYAPANVVYNAFGGALDSLRLYRSFSFGDLAELVCTDERLYRDGPPCGFATQNRSVAASCPERERASRTMLGVTQKEWFIEKLKSSRSVWKIWANEIMAMQLKALPLGQATRYLTLDSWDGYPAERADILRRLQGIQNFIAITGDIHSYACGYLKADYETLFYPATGIEFVGGSVTSSNLAEILEAQFPTPSQPVPKSSLNIPPEAIEAVLRIFNPWVQFFHSATHGYVVLDIDQIVLRCRMWRVSTIREPVAEKSLLRTFAVLRNFTWLFNE